MLKGHSRETGQQTYLQADPNCALNNCKQVPGEENSACFQKSESFYLSLYCSTANAQPYMFYMFLYMKQTEKRNKNITPESVRLRSQKIRITTDSLKPMPVKGK